MKFLNLNTAHNVLNILITIAGALLAADWTLLASFGISPQQIGAVIGILSLIKLVANAVRDGLSGMVKVQPPVADKDKTIVVSAPGDAKIEVKTPTPRKDSAS